MRRSRHKQAAEYRRKAREIWTIVQTLLIDEAREQFLETAERLETLAAEEEYMIETNSSGPKPQPEA